MKSLLFVRSVLTVAAATVAASAWAQLQAPSSSCLALPLATTPWSADDSSYALNATDACVDRVVEARPAGVLAAVGVISPGAALTSEFLSDTAEAGAATRRLETAFTWHDKDGSGSWRVGDSVLRPVSWGRPFRYGGVQWGPGVAAKPASRTLAGGGGNGNGTGLTPTPGFGQPSAMVMDAGELRFGMRDLPSRDAILALPAMPAPVLLRPGVEDYAFEAGLLREQYAVRNTDYGAGFAAATWRMGLNDGLTTELHAEGHEGLSAAGAAAVFKLPELGLVSAALAGSESEHGSGVLRQVGFERVAPVKLSMRGEWTNREFMSLGRDPTQPQRALLAFNAGYALFGRHPLEFGYARQAYFGAEPTESVSARYAMPLGRRARLAIVATHQRAESSSDSVGVNVSLPLGPDAATRAGSVNNGVRSSK
ncbi:MAG TPA: hypothetical protein VFS42_09375 [Burkholderiaceae bacterium]|nr:hypothetical protein [Burkholderiaceae bacterium]